MVQSRTILKNQIHAILLQNRIQVRGNPFSAPWISRVRRLGNFRIDDKLGIIDSINDRIAGGRDHIPSTRLPPHSG